MTTFRKTRMGLLLLALILGGSRPAALMAQQSANALPWRMNTAYNLHLMRQVHGQYDLRTMELDKALSGKESMQSYLEDRKKGYLEILGELPGESELNARVVSQVEGESFHLENIIFESMPGRYVTANLYLPKGEGPFPVALELCGHGLDGKKYPGQLRLAQLFANRGIALMVVDPIGQGERIQFLNDEGLTRTRGATTEHTLLNAGANLVGTSLAALEYWDNHRALDYLAGRKDIQADAMGVFGSSGGGTQTAYMVGLDERVRVASVCSYFTKREKVLEIYGPSDGCQHIPYEGREKLEIADLVMLMAPKPVLIMSGKYDFVDYRGALQSFDELKKVYSVLGYPDHAAMFSIEGGHGMPEPKKQALVSWFGEFLGSKSPGQIPSQAEAIPMESLLCTATGQVLTSLSDGKSVQEYHLELARDMEARRRSFLEQGPDALRQKMEELLAYSRPVEELVAEQTGSFSQRTFDVKKYQLVREGEMPVPCLVLVPSHLEPDSKVVLYLHDGGKEEILRDEPTVLSFINEQDILVLADLRGFGETADPLRLNDTKYWNREYRNAMTSMHMGKPIMGQRVTDIVTLVDFLEQDADTRNRPVHLKADGLYGPAALHAAFLDERIMHTEVNRSVKSFMEYLENPLQRDVYSNVLYGVLRYYDLQDVARMSGRARFVD